MIQDAFTLPPFDGPFATWLQTQPTLYQVVCLDNSTVRYALRSRTRVAFEDGRDAAQRIRSVADRAGFVGTAHFYYEVYDWFCLRLIAL